MAERVFRHHRFNHKCTMIAAGRTLRIEVLERAICPLDPDGWRTVMDSETRDTGLGLDLADLPTAQLAVGARIQSTFRWLVADRWEGVDFALLAVAAPPPTTGES